MAEKYSIEVDEKNFDIFYGFKGSLEIDIPSLEIENPEVSNILLNKERKSLEIDFEDHEYAGPIWFRLPPELISAERGEFQVLIDDAPKPFELTYYANDVSVGFFIPEGTQKVEIIGTSIIPEFSIMTVLVLGIAMTFLIIFTKNRSLPIMK